MSTSTESGQVKAEPEPQIIFDIELEPWVKVLRFALGFVFGVAASLLCAFRWRPVSLAVVLLVAGVSGLCCGRLALRYGDSFWENPWRRWPW